MNFDKGVNEQTVEGIMMIKEEYEKIVKLIKRVSASSCCLYCDSCLSCDAEQLLRELGESK